jgi:hypothetical protein
VVLLVLGSLSNVVGYQTVQTSQQNLLKERINQRELLFQTIIDIANNKDIQRIILKSQMMSGKFLISDVKLPTPVTKQQLRQIYFLGLMLSKFISKSRMQSMVGKYQFSNQEMQKEISAVIEKDATLNAEITQLQNSECDCENENTTDSNFPVICSVLLLIYVPVSFILGIFSLIFYYIIPLYFFAIIFGELSLSIFYFAEYILKCSWAQPPPLEETQ